MNLGHRETYIRWLRAPNGLIASPIRVAVPGEQVSGLQPCVGIANDSFPFLDRHSIIMCGS